MNKGSGRHTLKGVFVLGGLLAVGYVVVFLAVALKRLPYPYELEWVEGAVLIQVRRVLAGQALYTPPSLDYIPLIYPPLYVYASALAAAVVGPTFTAQRLVSLVSTLVTMGVLARWLTMETRDRWAALAGVGFYAAVYRLNGTWYDVGRVDAFALMWVLVGLYTLRRGRTAKEGILAALAFLLAFWSKQTTLWVALPVLVHASIWGGTGRRSRRVFVAAFVLLLVSTYLIAHLATQGWLTYYLFYLPLHFQLAPRQAWRFWKDEMLGYTALAFTGALLFLWWRWSERAKEDASFWGAVFLGLVGSAWLARAHGGSFLNDLMPAHLALALGWGLFLARARAWPMRSRAARDGAVALLLLVQMTALLYDPRLVLPPDRNRRAGQMVEQRLAQVVGDVFVPYHPYLAVRAGKPAHAHMAAITDVIRGDPDGWGKRLRAALRQALRERTYQVVLLEQARVTFLDAEMERLVEQAYGPPDILFRDEQTFRTITGWRIRPERWYERK